MGVPQSSLFYYRKYWEPTSNYNREYFKIKWHEDLTERDHEYTCSAFTVAELGELLPKGFWHITKGARFHITCVNASDHAEANDTEVEARAKMLIYLLENNLMKIGE